MIRTTIFRANPGFRVILKDVKYEPEVGRPLEILQEDVDLAVQGDVDIKKIANSGELRYAVQHGWLIPIEHPDSGLMNEIFGGANNAPSLQERAAAASPTLPRKPQAASIPPQPQIHTPAATVEEQIQPDLPTLPAGTKYGPGNILLTLDEKYQLVNNQWVAYNPVTSSPKPPTVLPTRAGVTVQQKSTQDDTLVERVTTAKESGGFQTLKSAMPVTGEEGTILVGSPSRVIAEMGNKPVTISPANRNKFRRLKGMKDTFITAFGNAGIAQPSDLLRFQPDQLLAMLGLAAVTPNQDMVSSWAEMVAQMHNVSPDQG